MTMTMPPPTATPPTIAPPPPHDSTSRVAIDDYPRDVRHRTTSDILALVGSAIGSLALDWILYERVLPFSGGVGFFVCWYLLFLCFYAGLTAIDGSRALVVDRLASAAIHAGAVIAGLGLATAIIFTYVRGHAPMGYINTYTTDAAGAGPQDPLSRG